DSSPPANCRAQLPVQQSEFDQARAMLAEVCNWFTACPAKLRCCWHKAGLCFFPRGTAKSQTETNCRNPRNVAANRRSWCRKRYGLAPQGGDFRWTRRRISEREDWVAERTGFELSAPFLVCQTTANCFRLASPS